MSDNKEKTNKEASLIHASYSFEKSLSVYRDINQKARFIALCSSIEAARMRSKQGTFAIVSKQIDEQAGRNEQLSERLESLVNKIKFHSLEASAARNLEQSMDLIDKIDRNLFERNCDVQAWVTFDAIQNAALASQALGVPSMDDPTKVKKAAEESSEVASNILNLLVKTYCVYADSFLLNENGEVIAAANHREYIGKKWNELDWFKEAKKGAVHVTELHFNEAIRTHSVNYCSPVKDSNGEIIGVLCNVFNWEFALEIIVSANFNSNTAAVIIDNNSRSIGSTKNRNILEDRFDWLRAGELAANRYCGYSLEYERNGEPVAVGFARTAGYNAYPGKGWSALVIERLGNYEVSCHANTTKSRAANQAAPSSVSADDKVIASERIGDSLQSVMKEIDQLVHEINANNRQVKLLAVNASIQAGLAGADGEGFSIIANEVSGLTRKSLNFVKQVNDTTAELRYAVNHAISARLEDAAKDTMSKIDRNLFERYCDIQAWSAFSKFSELLKDGDTHMNDAVSLLKNIHRIYEVYHDIYIIKPSGKVVAAAVNHSLVNHDFSNAEWFRGALNGTVQTTDLHISDTLRLPSITFASAIYDSHGTVIGIIASEFNWNFVNDIIRAAIVDSTTDTYLLNHQHEVIGSRSDEDVLQRSFLKSEEIRTTMVGEFGITEESDSVKDKVYSIGFSRSRPYNTYKGQKWTVITRRAIESHDATNAIDQNLVQIVPPRKAS
jgi:hypothetical protein